MHRKWEKDLDLVPYKMGFKSQKSVTVLRGMFIRQMRNKKYRTENRLHLHQKRKHDWHVMKERATIRY